MKRIYKILSVLLLILGIVTFVSCGETKKVDYASQIDLDKTFAGKTFLADGIEEVKLHITVDGDTIHIKNNKSEILKLRFLGVDTPESTGAVEPWGKTASLFTKDKVVNAISIVIESDGGPAVVDSTGDRYLSWIWYKTDEETPYRLLNLELVQEGLSFDKSSGCILYKENMHKAANQALKLKIGLRSNSPDENYYYGEANELTLRQLRNNVSDYVDSKVAFEALVTRNDGPTVYVEDYDPETDTSYGMQVYAGPNFTGSVILKPGNRVRICGTVTFYETGNTYQVSGITYIPLSKTQENMQLISTSNEVIAKEVLINELTDTSNTIPLYTFVSLKNVVVKSTYTTAASGAMSITCEVDGKQIVVRTVILYDHTTTYIVDSTNRVTVENFNDKILDVSGVLEIYEGKYQIKLFSMNDVKIK